MIIGPGSNHSYDTRDYKTISPYFGNYCYFKKLDVGSCPRGCARTHTPIAVLATTNNGTSVAEPLHRA